MAVTLFLLWVAQIRLQWCLLRTLRFWVTVAFPSCSRHHSLPLSLPPPGRKHMTQASMWQIQISWQLQLQGEIKSHLYCSTLRNNRSGHWLSKTIRLVFLHLHQFNWSDRNTEIKASLWLLLSMENIKQKKNLTLSGGGNCSWLASNGVMRGMVSNPSSETTLPVFFSLKLFPSLTIFPARKKTNTKPGG